MMQRVWMMIAVIGMAMVMAGAGTGTGTAKALPPLSQQAEIADGLLAIGIADEVRKRCDRIAPRYVAALGFMRDLEQKAEAMGYTPNEIDAYVTSKAEKARMRARGEAVLAAAGVRPDAPDSYCSFGMAEIAKRSLIGSFLRAR